MPTLTQNGVTEVPAAPAVEAVTHFEDLFRFEADCWDVHAALESKDPGFVLLDVRSPQAYDKGHIDGALSLPHGRINERNLAPFAADTLFVVYCTGPHCNGADRGALRLAKLRRPVKKMIGGVTGWLDEGLTLVAS